MLLNQIWILYIVICISAWLPSTNPSVSLSSASSVSSNSFSESPSDESSIFLPASSFTFSSSPIIYPINDDDEDHRSKQFSGESYRTRFTRSYRNFGLHKVEFKVPSGVILGENTTAPESGPWAPWSKPSPCSRPCGGGVRFQKRFCEDIDAFGRSTCRGPHTRYYSCNIHPCPEPVDFRSQQCSMFNNQSIPLAIGNTDKIEWEPYTGRSTDRRQDDDLCSLNCKPKNGTWYTRLMEQVIDGTKCLHETDWVSGICVAGNCLPVGCDGLLGSTLEEDKCRVCGGEGRDCNTVRDTFAEKLAPGYQDIVLIPRGATYIRIQELSPSNAFLAIRDSSGRYYLNGDWTFDLTVTDFEAGGTRFEYGKRPPSSSTGAIAESLYALGPLRSPLYIQMLFQDEANPGIEYEYSVPSNVPVPSIWAPADAYQYMIGSYGPCSRPCGKGVQTRPARCVRLKTGEFVPQEFCSREIMPQLSRFCNEIDCPPAYHKGNWSSCICPGIKTRSVFCEEIRASGERLVLDDSKCGSEPKPNSIASCPPNDCYELTNLVGNQTEKTEFKWNTTEWSKCSSRCGQGKRSREVTCVDLNGTRVHDSQCPSNERPESEGVCASVPCEGGVDWVTSEWSNCSVSCGPMMSTRSVICAGTDGLIYDESVCGLERKPAETRNCTENPGCDYSWFTTDWSSCSASCGRGVQTRHVLCGLYDDDSIKVDETKCANKTKPISVRTCRAPVECKATLYYGPWGPCQCGNEERTLLCLSSSTAGGKLPLEKCNVTTSKEVKSESNVISPANETLIEDDNLAGNETITGNSTLTGNETIVGNETLVGNETIVGNETLAINETLISNEISTVALTLIQTNRTCEWDRPPKEADVSDVAPEPSGNNSLPVDCCSSQFGCCPDKFTPRKYDFSNCFKEDKTEITTTATVIDQVTTVATTNGSVDSVASPENNTESIRVEKATPPACLTSTYGCCWDGVKPAFGPFKLGCPVNCNNTLFGCCPDNKTAKTNETGLNCPPKCFSSPFGCCDDNITEAGVNRTNCPIIPIPGPGDTDENIEGSGASEICLEVEGSGDGDSDGNVTTSCSKPAKAKATTSVTCTDGSNGTICSPVTKEPSPPCNTTTFGCCPDGLAARKTETDDCTCSGSEFGCCPDNKTLATGPNQEGCPCNTFPFKCCQDEYTRATGPDYEGCTCSRMLFGCCSDGVTPARGPNQLGCGCKSTPYGCCPDNSTTAGGPNYAGCPCRTLPHGCCPDAKTPAKGPNSEGCPCESLSHGCCFDGVTPATGPNYAGCDCTKAPWHCCQDYTTVALGPNFEGCPGGPALEISRAPDACVLPRERGPCRNFTIKWYYDTGYGGCVRFWYGGCNGNANRFQSEEECEKICINPDGYQRCKLSPIFGACGLNITKYYFNPETRSCETFQYSGCLGNKNNFNTRLECEAFCLHPETLDRCDQPVDSGHCNRKQTRYHYDRSTDSCQPFDWGGCGGNQNNFHSVEDCQRSCSVVKKEMPETLCYLPRAEGKCLGRYPRWFFDGVTQECREFIYTGCDGNHNRFVSKTDCEKMCNSTRRAISRPYIPAPLPSIINPPSIDVCKLPVSTGSAECNDRLVKWYYNDIHQECVAFDYRGCGGNGNRFNSKEECEGMCSRSSRPYYPSSYPVTSPTFMGPIGPPAPEPGVDQCTLPQSRGVSCLGRNKTVELRWSFDLSSRTCQRFYYDGCEGTANNFLSENECLSTCASHIYSPTRGPIPLPIGQDLPARAPTESVARPWPSPPSVTQSNNPKVTETNELFNPQSCMLPKDRGSGRDSIQYWFYDPLDGVCKPFYYTGLGGNTNRFGSRKECELKCWSVQDICKLPPIRGKCAGNYPVYYFDYISRQCLPLTYGGCEGNANRFDSVEECRMRCRG